MTIRGCLILIWSCLEGFCEPTALHKLTQSPVFYEETINVFSPPLPANEERKRPASQRYGAAVGLRPSNTVLSSARKQRREEQRRRLRWLPGEPLEFCNVLSFPHDQIWIFGAFCSLSESLADSAAGTISSIFSFLPGIHLGGALVRTAAL